MTGADAEWVSYFEYLIAAAGVILGIAFLAFQVRPASHLSVAKQIRLVATLMELSAPMAFGLLFLIPGHPWMVAGWIVGCVGWALTGSYYLAFVLFDGKNALFRWSRGALSKFIRKDWLPWVRTLDTSFDRLDRLQLKLLPVSVVTYGILLFWPRLDAKAYVLLWLIFSGLSEAWLFLWSEAPGNGRGGRPVGQ